TGQEQVAVKGHLDKVSCLDICADGKTAASGSSDSTVRLWNVKTGQELRTLRGHTLRVTALAFTPDGKILASAGGEQAIKLWNVASGKELHTLKWQRRKALGFGGTIIPGDVLLFTPDAKMLVSGSTDKEAKLWEVETGKEAASSKLRLREAPRLGG